MSGNAHLPYLVVSLWTLRNYWKGPIIVYAYPESFELLLEVAKDDRLNIEPRVWEPPYRGKNGQFINKILLLWSLDEFVSLYIDADTSIHGPVDVILDRAEEFGFAATQWVDWVTTGVRISARIRRLQQFIEIDQKMVQEVLANRYPSVNGGVFASQANSPVLPLWHEWTMAAKSIFIADETVLHVLQPKFCKSGMMDIVLGGRYNCSPIYQPLGVDDNDIVIRHYHGDSNCRPAKSLRGCEMWLPMYCECIRQNIGNVATWHESINNQYLKNDWIIQWRKTYDAKHGLRSQLA